MSKQQKTMYDNGNEPIHPTHIETPFGSSSDGTVLITHAKGLTKREYFAGLAMASYFGGEYTGQSGMPDEDVAERCVSMANALLAELAKTDKP